MAAWIQSWAQTLGAMIDNDVDVQVSCSTCGVWKPIGPRLLAMKVGRGYSLVNRRCRCKLTYGCKGWNKFYYRHGVFRPLWDHSAFDRWIRHENAELRAIDSQSVNG